MHSYIHTNTHVSKLTNEKKTEIPGTYSQCFITAVQTQNFVGTISLNPSPDQRQFYSLVQPVDDGPHRL